MQVEEKVEAFILAIRCIRILVEMEVVGTIFAAFERTRCVRAGVDLTVAASATKSGWYSA